MCRKQAKIYFLDVFGLLFWLVYLNNETLV